MNKIIVGIDEAGRGPIAGPVFVGCVSVMSKHKTLFDREIKGIRDSKKMSSALRKKWLSKLILLKKENIINFSYASVSTRVIDKIGISKSIKRAVKASLLKLSLISDNCEIFLDGSLRAPRRFVKQKTIIDGDEKLPIISAASVVAKEFRDAKMLRLAKIYKNYGFEKHKGYGSKEHFMAIKKFGLTP
jgi:ribonuclease HII